MPRRALDFLEAGNVSNNHEVDLLCAPDNHHKKCRNPLAASQPSAAPSEEGCATTRYWRARQRIGMPPGKPAKQISATGRTAGIAAERLKQKRLAVLAEFGKAPSVAPTVNPAQRAGLTLDEAVTDWLDHHRETSGIAETTLTRYQTVQTNVISESALGKTDLSEITHDDIWDFLDSIQVLREDGKWTRGSYLKPTFYILNRTFKHRPNRRLIASNPMLELDAPRPKPNSVRTAARPVTRAEFALIRDVVAEQPRFAPYFLPLLDFMAGSGVRISEALAITRSNLVAMNRPEDPFIVLDGHLIPLAGGKARYKRVEGLKESKTSPTGDSVLRQSRYIMAPPRLAVQALNEQLARVADASPDALVFTSRTGSALTPRNIRRTLQVAAKRANVASGVSTHSFRKMLAEAIDAVTDDSGLSASNFIGNEQGTTNAHYIAPKPRMSRASTGALVDDFLRGTAPERYE